ncbi:STY0301 family protein [Pokkaliibacter sp. CJK22405]|uniref:STY0301 family protein n=1 Tax=Pokkaliibacter sp. CJK22405 TaxID=3384615 RepID=UPI0039848D94
MKHTAGVLSLPLVFLLCAPCLADTLHCPASITEQPQVQATAAPWVIKTEQAARRLDRVEIVVGPLEEPSVQVPDATTTEGTTQTDRWELVGNGEQEYLLGCRYLDTSAVLYQSLPEHDSVCEASYQLTPQGQRQSVISVNCH